VHVAHVDIEQLSAAERSSAQLAGVHFEPGFALVHFHVLLQPVSLMAFVEANRALEFFLSV